MEVEEERDRKGDAGGVKEEGEWIGGMIGGDGSRRGRGRRRRRRSSRKKIGGRG